MCTKLGLVTNAGHSACLDQVTYSLFLPCPVGSLTAPRCPHWMEGAGSSATSCSLRIPQLAHGIHRALGTGEGRIGFLRNAYE